MTKGEQAHNATAAEENDEITFTADELPGVYNFDAYNPHNVEENDDRLMFYDWLADTATTSHITNLCNVGITIW